LALKEMQKAHILKILETYHWNVTHAAKALEINRVTLHKMMKRDNLSRHS